MMMILGGLTRALVASVMVVMIAANALGDESEVLDPSDLIVSATGTVLDARGKELHFKIAPDQLPVLLKAVFPATPVTQRKLGAPLGALQFYHADKSLTRVRFYDDGENPLLFDVNRKLYRRSANHPRIDLRTGEPSDLPAKEGLRLQARLLPSGKNAAPNPNRPKFFENAGMSMPSIIGIGTYLFRVPAFDPNQEKLTYSFVPLEGDDVLPDGVLSIDDDTGDLYMSNPAKMPTKPGRYRVRVKVKNESGLENTIEFNFAPPGK